MKMLYITTFAKSRFGSFAKSSIAAARQLGIEYHIASNETGIDQSIKDLECEELGIYHHHIDINRNPSAVAQNRKAYKQIMELIEEYHFDVIHCNTPMGGVLGRLCGHKAGVKTVIYQAHGFHFWTGAPLMNWTCYYPTEKFLAHYTDILITINKEDKKRAQKFHLKKNGKLVSVPGVGIDVEKISTPTISPEEKRRQLGISQDSLVYITVGELIPRKNQSMLIDAFKKADIANSILLICGKGQEKDNLQKQIEENGLSEKVKLLGQRTDIYELLQCSDVFLFPSKQEGLPIALMEAMAVGLPCVAANIRGNNDLLGDNYPFLLNPNDRESWEKSMKDILDVRNEMAELSHKNIGAFDIEKATEAMKEIYKSVLER